MSRSGGIARRAVSFETADFTSSHPAYRSHLENERLLWCDLSMLVSEDGSQAAKWLYNRNPSTGRVGWFSRLFLSWRMSGSGKNCAEAVLEAAKDAVRQAMIHQEYIAAEGTPHNGSSTANGRYRTEV